MHDSIVRSELNLNEASVWLLILLINEFDEDGEIEAGIEDDCCFR
jgi:hypothetical protein